jgi:hypothetical protein
MKYVCNEKKTIANTAKEALRGIYIKSNSTYNQSMNISTHALFLQKSSDSFNLY